MKRQIRILGSGPAGLTAAINLARNGYEAKVFEKNRDCGMRFHGDFQGIENWSSHADARDDLKSMNVKINFFFDPVCEGSVFDSELNERKVTTKKSAAYIVRRGNVEESLDLGLKEQALDHGVELVFNRRVAESDVDIIAGGPSRVGLGIVRGMVFETEMKDTTIAVFDDSIAPKGYAYLVIRKGNGCLATCLFEKFEKANHCFDRTFERFNRIVSLEFSKAKYYSGFGDFFLGRSYERNGKLIVGEAAGLQDFLFGFGIRYAVTSGYLAAMSIVRNENYDRIVKKRFGRMLKASLVNRFLFTKLGNKGYQAFLKTGKRVKDPLGRIHKLYNPSLLKRLILPVAKISLKNRIH